MILSRHARAEANFARQQSLEMRCRDWEARAKPYRGWARDLLIGVAIGLFAIPVAIFAFVAIRDFFQQIGWATP